MRSDKPPTPPSKSAELTKSAQNTNTLSLPEVVKKLFSNGNFQLLASFSALIAGLTRTMLIKSEQIMCPLGYPSNIAGLAGPALWASSGIQVVYISALYWWKPSRVLGFIKLFPLMAVAGLFVYALIEVPSTSGIGVVATIAPFVLIGLGAGGIAPLLNTLMSDVIHPLPATAGMAISSFLSAIYSIVTTLLEEPLKSELKRELYDVQVCTSRDLNQDLASDDEVSGIQPYNYKLYKSILAALFTVIYVSFAIWFRPKPLTEEDDDTSSPAPTTATNQSSPSDFGSEEAAYATHYSRRRLSLFV